MDYYTENNQRLIFPQSDFKGAGGEGSVYVQNGLAYKIYADAANVIPRAKLQELSVLDRPTILRPRAFILDAYQAPAGYIMDAVTDALPLGRILTKTFRDRNRLTPDIILNLVLALREGVAYVHGKGITIVDLNENNFLVDTSFNTLYFIDVDSYQTPSFAASAISESVRDRHTQVFTDLSDWFSFAVVSFQLFTGIHPYRGVCPGLKTLDSRMQANVSVFNPKVTLPTVCVPFDVIPASYRDWYEAVLEQGYRCAPPDSAQSIVVLRQTAARTVGRSAFVVDLLRDLSADILDYLNGAVLTVDGVTLGTDVWPRNDVVLGFVPHNNTPIAAWVAMERLHLYDLMRGHEIAVDVACEAVVGSEGRLYAKRGGMLLELCFVGMPAGTMVSTRQVSAVPALATHLFTGVALLDLLGSWYACLLAGKGSAPQVRLKELDGYRLIDAKYQKRVLMVVAACGDGIDKFIYRFDERFTTQDVRIVRDISVPGVNFTVLDTGVCLHMTHEDTLEVYSNSPLDKTVNVFDDPALHGGCVLYKNGAQGMFAVGSSLYKFSMATT